MDFLTEMCDLADEHVNDDKAQSSCKTAFVLQPHKELDCVIMAIVCPPASLFMQDKSSGSAGLKIQALQFLHLALLAGKAQAWQPHLPQLLPPLLACVQERYYKVSAEALRMCTHTVPVLRPSPPAPVPPALQVFTQALVISNDVDIG